MRFENRLFTVNKMSWKSQKKYISKYQMRFENK